MRILTICPSRNRPQLLLGMLSSLMETKSQANDVILSFDEDDNALDENMNIAKRFSIPFFTSLGQTVTQHINNCYNACGKIYDYFHLTNDDVIYKTEKWDLELISRIHTYDGISYGNDGLQGKNLPTFPMISRKIVQTVGWLQQPTLNSFFGDMVWKDIGTAIGRLHYVEHVKIEHLSWINEKRVNDNPDYEKFYKEDQRNYALWVMGSSGRDIRKLKEALNESSNNKLNSIKR